MSFECGFQKVKKYKDATLEEILDIEVYLGWKNNPWNFELDSSGNPHYGNFKEYYETMFDMKCPNIDMDKVSYYENNKDLLSELICFWCSDGIYIDHIITSNLIKVDEYTYKVDKESLDNLLKEINIILDNHKLIPVYIIDAFNKNKESLDIDGVYLQSEEGGIIKFNLSTPLYMADSYFDCDKQNTFNELKDNLLKIKEMLNDDTIVYYYRSY